MWRTGKSIISMALFTYTFGVCVCVPEREAVVTRLHDFVLNIFLVVYSVFLAL